MQNYKIIRYDKKYIQKMQKYNILNSGKINFINIEIIWFKNLFRIERYIILKA